MPDLYRVMLKENGLPAVTDIIERPFYFRPCPLGERYVHFITSVIILSVAFKYNTVFMQW